MDRRLDILCANTIRVLSADAIEKANSGHPGLPLGAVDFAYILWLKFLRHYNKEPKWLNRDRFVLSAGHGSMLLYSLLHLFDYPMPLDEIKKFRQIGSLTPGHPEYGHTIGVETTTGPLGQGFANAVGMAIAEKMMQARLNKFGKEIINHKIFVLAGDGCIMEGITSEAASFAGHLCLNNLIVVYDDNNITIEGNTNITFSEDVCKKFEAMGWDTYSIDGHNFDEIEQTFEKVLKNQEKPVLIKAKTIIGKGAPTKNNHCDVHGSPLGKEELRRLKENLGFNPDEYFAISQEVYDVFKKRNEYLEKQYKEWQKEFEELYHNNSEFRRVYDLYFNNEIKLENLKEDLYKLFEKDKSIATRAASGKIMNFISEQIPALIGGSADLGTSTKTILDKYPFIEKNKFDGRNFHFGVREHSMAAICNGIALYGGFIPYCSSFFVFTDYLRPALRLSALMKLQVIYIMTHDSIFVGEDGPTHQPIEQAMCCRMIPNLLVFRPADAIETVDVWLKALAEKNRPSLVLLTRQNLPIIDRKKYNQSEAAKGGYIIKKEKSSEKLDMIIIATGSEISISLDAAEKLEEEGYSIRVVSMPCFKIFDEQSEDYKNHVLPKDCKMRIAVEAGISSGWERYVFDRNNVIAIDEFGISGPADQLAIKFGFTSENIIKKIKKKLTS